MINDYCHSSQQVRDWEISPACSECDGYLSEMLALDISYALDGELKRVKLVAKLLPQDPFNRAFVIETQFDLREIKFYTEVIPIFEFSFIFLTFLHSFLVYKEI